MVVADFRFGMKYIFFYNLPRPRRSISTVRFSIANMMFQYTFVVVTMTLTNFTLRSVTYKNPIFIFGAGKVIYISEKFKIKVCNLKVVISFPDKSIVSSRRYICNIHQ